MLDEPYSSISITGNHTLSHSDLNENLTDTLRKAGYINRVRIHEKSFLGIKSKSKITFTTKS